MVAPGSGSVGCAGIMVDGTRRHSFMNLGKHVSHQASNPSPAAEDTLEVEATAVGPMIANTECSPSPHTPVLSPLIE